MKATTFSFPDPKTKDADQYFVQRLFEVIPGAITWGILLGVPLLAFFLPVWVAVLIIAFDMYWIYKSFFVTTYTLGAYRRLRKGLRIDWHALLRETQALEKNITRRRTLLKDMKKSHFWQYREKEQKNIFRKQRDELVLLEDLRGKEKEIISYKDIIQVVMFPTANEGPEIIEPAIRAIQENTFPSDQTIILLATEENEDAKKREEKIAVLQKKFGTSFKDFLVTRHRVRSEEMKCKASNATFAAKELQTYLKERHIDPKRVIFSNFDCDTVAHPQYLSALAFAYVTEKDRLKHAYQPLPMYNNNIWDTNAFVRVVVFNSTFWHMFQSTRSQMVTFSSHSEPFDTLIRLNFWPVNMISEDSIIYWKGFSYYNGKYRTKIIPLPVSMDAALANSYIQTLGNQYKQLRRWAYGMENLPIVMRALIPNKKISFLRKAHVAFELIEGHVMWATAPIILGFLGWTPILFGGAKFQESVLAHNLPFITSYLMTMAMSGLFVIAALNFLLLPPKPEKYSRWRYVNLTLQWALIPFMGPFLIALPAIDAQTRLMFGKYFGSFWVTEKIRKS